MSRDDRPERPFLQSPLGLVLIGFLLVAGFLLLVEHRAHIFVGSWFVWLLPLACLAMHFFHGGHGGGHDHGGRPDDRKGNGE
jgi:hypothetical protein